MADLTQLKASARERVGKGATRVTRRNGLVPAVIYGDKQPPESISLEYREIWQQLQTGQFLSTVYMIDVGGSNVRAIPRDIQFDPVKDYPLHVDFLRLGKDARITVSIPVVFHNEEESPGLKRGGVLNIVRHDIEVSCLADSIPGNLVFDLAGLEIGDSVHFSAISLPEGVTATITDRDFTVATIAGAAPTEEEEEKEEGEEEEALAEADEATENEENKEED
jgi:large subunit ribosomal protein L25